jgi:epsilon-lactone hydrolase
MNNTRAGLIETHHALPEGERELQEGVLARIRRHFAVTDRSLRDSYDALMEDTPIAPGVTFSAVEQGEVRGWWARVAGAPAGRAILHLHGGGYYLGSARAYRGFASQIAARARVDAFIPDYPLAPEHPFPAAYNAALAARKWLGTRGVDQIALIGDSAGGGLALAAASDPAPTSLAVAAIVVFSPWVDCTLSGQSYLDPTTRDPIGQRAGIAASAARYLNGADPRDGRASPLFVIPSSLPPLAIQVGSDEVLLDDARRYAVAAAERGADVRLDIYEGLHHVFQIAVDALPSARVALDAAAEFLSRHW